MIDKAFVSIISCYNSNIIESYIDNDKSLIKSIEMHKNEL